MKNLQNFGVQEMNAKEIKETDGGLFLIFLAGVAGIYAAGWACGMAYAHYENRYWNYMLPLAIVVGVYAVMKLPNSASISASIFLIILSTYSGVQYLRYSKWPQALNVTQPVAYWCNKTCCASSWGLCPQTPKVFMQG